MSTDNLHVEAMQDDCSNEMLNNNIDVLIV